MTTHVGQVRDAVTTERPHPSSHPTTPGNA